MQDIFAPISSFFRLWNVPDKKRQVPEERESCAVPLFNKVGEAVEIAARGVYECGTMGPF